MHTLDGKADSAQVRQQLDRILNSTAFAGAARLQELLVYTIDEVLAGRGAELKETVIGQEVFDRSGHDPRLDSIVRVTISKLRGKLREYYLTEGVNDPVEIEFPRGGYAPVLKWRIPPAGEATAEAQVETVAPARALWQRVPNHVWGACAAIVVMAVALYVWQPRNSRPLDPIRFQVAPPSGVSLRPFPNARILVSPDGKKLAAATAEGWSTRILIRPLESLTPSFVALPSPGTLLTWSPDSRSVAYYNDGKLWRIDTAGGTPLEIGQAQNVRSAAWGSDGQLIYANGGTGGLFQIPLNGGKPTRLTEPDPRGGEVQHTHPHLLPGGEALLYTAVNADESQSTVYWMPLRNPGQRIALVKAHSSAGFLHLPDGRTYLLYVKGGALIAHPFDASGKTLSGEPFALEPKVTYYPFHATADFSAAGDVLIYRTASATQARKLVVKDRAGKTIGGGDLSGAVRYPRISRDGSSFAVEGLALDSSSGNLWVGVLDKVAAAHRVTLDPAGCFGPVWSPDAQSLVYGTHRMQGPGLYRKSLKDGVEQRVTLMRGTPTDWSPDGQWILFNHEDTRTGVDVWLARADGRSAPEPFRQTRHDESDGQFSPDSQWVAYDSKESGVWEIYAERFLPGRADRARVPLFRGYSPIWTKGGQELLFHQSGSLYAAARLPGDGLKFSEPKLLFDTTGYFHRGFGYHATPDGQKIVFSVPSDTQPQTGSDIGVLLWK